MRGAWGLEERIRRDRNFCRRVFLLPFDEPFSKGDAIY